MKWLRKLKDFTLESKRVLKVTKNPTGTEFKTTVKVTGLGILVIGLIGFIIQMLNVIILG